MKKNNLGFSILEILIAVVIINIAWTMLWASMDYANQARKNIAARKEISDKKSLLTRFLSEQSSWNGLITNNSSLRCVQDSNCQASQISTFREVQLVGTQGQLVHPLSTAGKGFRLDGSICDGFSESNPTDDCPFQYLIEWRGICKSATDCLKPRAEVRGTLRGKLSLISNNSINNYDFYFKIQDFTGSCPTNYVYVLGNFDLGTSDFCLSKYHMKATRISDLALVDGITIGSAGVATHKADSRADNLPWGSVDLLSAKNACANLGPNYHLITNAEWMTVARDIEGTAANWSGGAVGTGYIHTGHSDGWKISGQNFLAASADDNDGCFATGNPNCKDGTSTDFWQLRTFTLGNGSVLWDFAGNINTWIDPDGSGSSIGYDLQSPTWQFIFDVDDANLINILYPSITPNIGFANAFGYSGTQYTFSNNRVGNLSASNQGQALIDSQNSYDHGNYGGGTAEASIGLSNHGFGTIRREVNPSGGMHAGMGIFRGGKFDETTNDERRGGIYSAWIDFPPTSNFTNLGFRCTFETE